MIQGCRCRPAPSSHPSCLTAWSAVCVGPCDGFSHACVLLYTYIHIYIYIYIYIYIHVQLYVYIYICIYRHTRISTCPDKLLIVGASSERITNRRTNHMPKTMQLQAQRASCPRGMAYILAYHDSTEVMCGCWLRLSLGGLCTEERKM